MDNYRKEIEEQINFFCNYDCYYYDCGYDCPSDCPILELYTLLHKHQMQEEQEMLKTLGF